MKTNVGSYDSGVRFVAGCVMLIAANHGQAWGLAGFAVVASSVGFCPVYWLLGIETCQYDRTNQRGLPVGQPVRRTRTSRLLASPPRRRRRSEHSGLELD